jgi:hypothetical protein
MYTVADVHCDAGVLITFSGLNISDIFREDKSHIYSTLSVYV